MSVRKRSCDRRRSADRPACQGTPILRGRRSENGRLALVWCPYCRREHQHGWADGIGHVWAHCPDDDATFPHGYHIEPHPELGDAAIREHNEQAVRR